MWALGNVSGHPVIIGPPLHYPCLQPQDDGAHRIANETSTHAMYIAWTLGNGERATPWTTTRAQHHEQPQTPSTTR